MATVETSAQQALQDMGLGDAQQMMDQAREAMDEAMDNAAEFVRERPMVCLAGALAVGWLIGKLASR